MCNISYLHHHLRPIFWFFIFQILYQSYRFAPNIPILFLRFLLFHHSYRLLSPKWIMYDLDTVVDRVWPWLCVKSCMSLTLLDRVWPWHCGGSCILDIVVDHIWPWLCGGSCMSFTLCCIVFDLGFVVDHVWLCLHMSKYYWSYTTLVLDVDHFLRTN